MADGYTYDVFVSYSRRSPGGKWVQNHLYPSLSERVAMTCPGDAEPRFFLDSGEVHVGEGWADRICAALVGSKIIVPVLCHHYLRSDWCKFEWQTFHARWKSTKRRVILPIVIGLELADAPADVRELQAADFREYLVSGDGFRGSQLFLDMELKKVNPLSAELVKALATSPTWDDAWRNVQPPRNPRNAKLPQVTSSSVAP